MTDAGRWRLAGTFGLGLSTAALFFSQFTTAFPLTEYCMRRHPSFVLPLFEQARYTAISGQKFLLVLVAASLAYLAALWLAQRLRDTPAALLLLGMVPIGLVLALAPGYPVLSGDLFRYLFDGRILAVYGRNPFVDMPLEFPDDYLYSHIYFRSEVSAYGPLWQLAAAGTALVGGVSCVNSALLVKSWPCLAYLATTAALYVMFRRWQPERAIWGTMVYAWNPLVALEALQNGHNDVVAALPTAGAVWFALRGSARWALVLLAVAALVKPLALLLGPAVLLALLRGPSSSIRDTAWGLVVAAALTALGYLPFWAGLDTFQGLLRYHLFDGSPAKALLEALQHLGVALEPAMTLATTVASGLFLLLLGLLIWATWSRRLDALTAAHGCLFVYLLLGAQWFNPWYLLWIAPLSALTPDRSLRALGIAFLLLAPLEYAVGYASLPAVLLIFLPLALLALRRPSLFGWPSSAERAPRTEALAGA